MDAGSRPALGIGVDVISVEEVRHSLARFGHRYLDRIVGEAPESAPDPRVLAGRFAVKEAVAKALDVGDAPLPWSAIEVEAYPSGRARVRLNGPAARLADERGLEGIEAGVRVDSREARAIAVARYAPRVP